MNALMSLNQRQAWRREQYDYGRLREIDPLIGTLPLGDDLRAELDCAAIDVIC